ncbi:MAG: zinc-binding dehydrogenase, partial [Comamonas sp.]
GNASGPVPPISLAALAAKGLYLTRPSVFVYAHSRSATQAMADDLFDVVTSGKVDIHIAQRYALKDVRAAHEALEARQTTGSSILTV